jgi:hypothetical protein
MPTTSEHQTRPVGLGEMGLVPAEIDLGQIETSLGQEDAKVDPANSLHWVARTGFLLPPFWHPFDHAQSCPLHALQ